MKNFKVFFNAGQNYKTTIPAENSGDAQTKFAKWFEKVFKPQKNITEKAQVQKIVELENPLNELFNQAFKFK